MAEAGVRGDGGSRRDKLLDLIAKRAHRHTGQAGRARAEAFLRLYYARLSIDELSAMEPDALAEMGLHHLKAAHRREAGHAIVKVTNPHRTGAAWNRGHTVVEIVTDDMPFLVDSVTAVVNGRGVGVHLSVHPVMRVRRTARGQVSEVLTAGGAGADQDVLAESFIHLQIDEQPDARLGEIEAALKDALTDVRLAVNDWRAMRDRLAGIVQELESQVHMAKAPATKAADAALARDFLHWVHDDNFTLLGYREYEFNGSGPKIKVSVARGSGLGVLRDAKRVALGEIRELGKMPPQVRDFIAKPDSLMITKSDMISRVHRPVAMDFIGVKRFDAQGRVAGQRVFVGLFTAGAYNKSARDIPLLKQKIDSTFARAGLPLSSHDGKALANILETFPRDELFQISADQLLETSLGILRLQDRQRAALFLRRDDFERFVSCLIYVPRDRYTTDLRRKFQKVLEETLNGTVSAHYALLSEQPLARLHVVVRTQPGQIPAYDVAQIEARLAEMAQSWSDRLGGALIAAHGEMEGMRLLDSYQEAFGRGYEDRFGAAETIDDINKIEMTYVFRRLGLNLYQLDAQDGPPLRFKIYHPRQPVALSDVLPMLEDLGLRVIEEIPFQVRPKDAPYKLVMHDFGLEPRGRIADPAGDVRHRFHEAFDHIWEGRMESDPLNALILLAGLDWREVTVLRALTKYLRQAGIAFSEDYMAATLVNNAPVARAIAEMFKARLALGQDAETGKDAQRLRKKLDGLLEAVTSADEDRILRRYVNLVDAALRTNFFQADADGEPKAWLSFKLSSQDVQDLPLPRPKYEIFVYSPEVEGVHLRFGNVARGGLRWSDRREDFRTEVLGLVKAQQVKNAVIVPVGSKGGFVVKRPPAPGASRDEVLDKGIACYKTFVRGLLDLTDNLDAQGKVVPPKRVTRQDGDDPYLVVAADKGTATFSDIANGVSAEYGFWLGDAFASGGSQGYDHKKMGITARGAWESVKRHFREMGRDTQGEDFSVAGVGDMSGDVFGNGMLLSPHIRLVAAFNHMHIFVDPNPDPAKSLKERQRLFDLPRSGWNDYDAKLISKGGGVFDRRAKWIDLTPEMKALFGVTQERATPADLMRWTLLLEVDLLWFGGIGTYVKSSQESNADAGDRANDAVRVNGQDVRARVIGEGANLGVTQRGRVEYALKGGRLNTDAIDNSAGVDCSDHEVNIKILLDALVRQKKLTAKARNALLVRMTGEVARLVLRDNYAQTQAISLIQAYGRERADAQMRLMRLMEKQGRLNRAVEFLPGDDQLGERVAAGQGLTRPEIAVLMSYSKIWLYDELLAGGMPDDPYMVRDLIGYFPTQLQKKYADAIGRHRLKREIVATAATNSLINRVGGVFVSQIMEKTGMRPAEIARAFVIARDVFGARDLWAEIEALDNKVLGTVQTAMLMDINRLLERATMWLLRNGDAGQGMADSVKRFRPGVAAVAQNLAQLLPVHYAADLQSRTSAYADQGVPAPLAQKVAGLVNLAAALDVVGLAERGRLDVAQVARLHFAVGSRFRLGRLRAACEALDGATHWQKLAVAALIEELFALQVILTRGVLATAGAAADPERAIAQWVGIHQAAVERTEQLLGELWSGEIADISQVAVASRALKALTDGGA